MFQPNFLTFTSTDVVSSQPLEGKFKGNQNDGMEYVLFADGSGGITKQMKDWHGNKTGRLYPALLLASQEFLAARVGEITNAPIRDCLFASPDLLTVIMPYVDGKSGEELGKSQEDCYPNNAQGGNLRLFDYLTANADRRPKNLMFTAHGIVGIDHALCNFRPREADPEVVSALWNAGLTTDALLALQPRLATLEETFQRLAQGERFQNLMDNLDKLIKAFQMVSAHATSIAKGESIIPPKEVQEVARRALEWIADGKAGDGFTPVGRKRASDLAHGHKISLDTLKRMKAYFDRHQPDKKAEGFRQGEHGYPSAGRVAWDAWGGDAGYSWVKTVVNREVKKGDNPGHNFHGNQYTDTEGHTQVHPDFKFGKEGSLEGAKIDPAKVGEICMSPEYTAFLNKTLGTSHTAVNPWTKEVTEVHPNNAIYGGCLATAEALKSLFPNGEIKATITTSEAHITDAVAQGYHPMVDHFVLSVGDGKFMDGRGLITEQQATDLNGMGPMSNGLYFNHLVEATPAMIDEKRPMILSPAGAPEALANFIMQRAGVSKSVSKAAGEIWAKFALFTIRKGDIQGHEFHGNQWTGGVGSGETANQKVWTGTPEDYHYLKALTSSKNLPRLKSEIPKGWKQVPSGDPKKILYESENGNTAIFAKGSKGWAAGERLSNATLSALDKLSTGKTLDFTQTADASVRTNAWVSAKQPDVICMGKWSSVASYTYWASGELPGMQEASQSVKDSYEQTMGKPFPTGEQAEITPEAMQKSFTYGDLLSNPESSIENTVAHELGHSNFYSDGHKIDEIYSALNQTSQIMGQQELDWNKVVENATNQYVARTKYGLFQTVSDGVMPRSEYAQYSIKQGSGSVELPNSVQQYLVSLGASRYGASSLQELVAETHSAYQNPAFPLTPLVSNIAKSMGWTRVAKSAKVGFMTKSVEPTSISPEPYVADGPLGPMWIEGNQYRDVNGDWHELDTDEPTDLMWFIEARMAQAQDEK